MKIIHYQMSLQARLKTCSESWPQNKPTPESLAIAGFICIAPPIPDEPDAVKCAFRGHELTN